jgi:lysine-N-methylase
MLTLETNNEDWIPYLQNCISLYKKSEKLLADFEKQHPEIEKYLKNISIYFIWRYFLKGVFDEEIISKISLMAISVSIIKVLFFTYWQENNSLSLADCVEIVRKYSEEIEYNEDNLNKLADACYEQEIFNIENLMGLF